MGFLKSRRNFGASAPSSSATERNNDRSYAETPLLPAGSRETRVSERAYKGPSRVSYASDTGKYFGCPPWVSWWGMKRINRPILRQPEVSRMRRLPGRELTLLFQPTRCMPTERAETCLTALKRLRFGPDPKNPVQLPKRSTRTETLLRERESLPDPSFTICRGFEDLWSSVDYQRGDFNPIGSTRIDLPTSRLVPPNHGSHCCLLSPRIFYQTNAQDSWKTSSRGKSCWKIPISMEESSLWKVISPGQYLPPQYREWSFGLVHLDKGSRKRQNCQLLSWLLSQYWKTRIRIGWYPGLKPWIFSSMSRLM